MPSRKLTTMFGLSEDRVATRALVDIIGKAVDSGVLSSMEAQWAHQLKKAIEKSGPDQLVYPKLSFDAPPRDDKKSKTGGSSQTEPKRGIDIDPSSATNVPDQGMAGSQSAWDSFANFPMRGDDVELGAAGVSPPTKTKANVKPSAVKKGPGMLSRIFGTADKKGLDVRPAPEFDPSIEDPSYGGDFPRLKRPKAASTKVKARPERRPGGNVTRSTWNDLSHSGPRAPEPRGKSSPGKTWDDYANQGHGGERKSK